MYECLLSRLEGSKFFEGKVEDVEGKRKYKSGGGGGGRGGGIGQDHKTWKGHIMKITVRKFIADSFLMNF
ncbi:hypothetical protein OUZ56_007991 [Daphnia magna]|uniref:Uncharacterized protein n=1 Tax=Daphnia magna TaxID=35525 RepID=A0ABR0ABL5_9CRUS|nr:hypothetical protein OUZ56_007991 [Daphnia magna]